MAAYKKKGISANGLNQGTLFEFLRRMTFAMLSSPGLVIKTSGSAIVKAGSHFTAIAGNTLVSKAANTDMAALVGTVTNGKFNIYVFYVNAAGTLSSAMGTEGATLAAVIPPVTPTNAVAIGHVIINPTGTGNFVGGTTPLDDGTVAPGALYSNYVGSQDLNRLRDLLKL